MQGGAVVQLQQHLKAAQSKRVGWAVGLWGEAGVGKTFTVQSLLRQTPVRSVSLHATAAERAWVQALPQPDKLPLWAEHISRRVTQGQAVEPKALLDLLAGTLEALAPFVLYLEDIHEASPERLEFIGKLAQAVSRLRGVGLLVTSRAEPPEPFKGYRLEPLDQPALSGLLKAQAKGVLPLEALNWVYERTQGNPLFALEFWRYLSRQGFLWSDGQDWHWRTPDRDFVPASVEGLISQMIQGATDTDTRAVLEARAIFPSSFDGGVLETLWAEVAEVEPESLLEVRKGLEARGVFVGERFAHPLFHEVVGRETLAERRQGYARRAIALLEPTQPEQAAEFLGQAGLETAQAVALLERAATQAEARDDSAAKGRWLTELVRQSPPTEQAERALRAAQALKLSHPDKATRMAEIAALATPPSPEAVFLLVELLASQGLIVEAESRLRLLPQSEAVALRWWETQIRVAVQGAQWPKLVELWDSHPEHQAVAKPLFRIMVARGYVSMRQLEQGQQLLASLPSYESLEPPTQIALLNVQGQLYSYSGSSHGALECGEKLIALSRAINSPANVAKALLNYTTDCQSLGLYERIKPGLEEVKQIATQIGDGQLYAVALLRLAAEHMDSGEFEKAETLLLEGQHLLQRHSTLHFLSECQNKLARLYLRWQPPYGIPLALKHARMALEYAKQSQDSQMMASALGHLAQAELLAGNAQQGLAVAQEGLEFCLQKKARLSHAWFTYGLALEANGRPQEAKETIEKAHALQGEPMMAQLFALELYRMDGNLKAARERYEGFVSRGWLGLAHVTLRYFPQLGHATPPEQEEVVESTPLRLNVLGAVLLEHAGEPLRIRAKKRLEVLAYLLEARVAGRAEVDILELVDVFYSDLPEDRAKLTLRQLIYLIRNDLGAESVESTPNGYALGAVGSDLEQFLESGDPGLWRGVYLRGLSDGWNANVRDGLQLALRASAEERLASEPNEAVRLGQIWLEMEPYDPEALRLVLRALQVQGKLKAAERAYQQAQERFTEVGERLPGRLEDFLEADIAS